jgi:hypothetical protein
MAADIDDMIVVELEEDVVSLMNVRERVRCGRTCWHWLASWQLISVERAAAFGLRLDAYRTRYLQRPGGAYAYAWMCGVQCLDAWKRWV